jgi:hypothetical protein
MGHLLPYKITRIKHEIKRQVAGRRSMTKLESGLVLEKFKTRTPGVLNCFPLVAAPPAFVLNFLN